MAPYVVDRRFLPNPHHSAGRRLRDRARNTCKPWELKVSRWGSKYQLEGVFSTELLVRFEPESDL
jgi:hypothetical protein